MRISPKITAFSSFFLFLLLSVPSFLIAQTPREKVTILEVRDEIGPAINRYVELGLKNAQETGADYVLIDMDTYGGALKDADDIRKNILDFDKPVFVFINKNAASAGALISLACDRIYMTEGASIGAATVVNGDDGAAAPDKYQSYMRSLMRATAEANGRNPEIAEAMVDQNLEVPGISEKGKVLTFTVKEALKHGFCDGKTGSLKESLEAAGLKNFETETFRLSMTDWLIALFLNPAVSGILIMLIFGGIYFELQSPGIGFPLAVALTALAFYFVPYYLHGLAEYWEIILFFVGALLLGIEFLVLPGFGIAGIAGFGLVFVSLIFTMVPNNLFNFDLVSQEAVSQALLVSAAGVLGMIGIIIFGTRQLLKSRAFGRISNQSSLKSDEGYKVGFQLDDLIGAEGTAFTVLRPSGRVMIEDKIYQAMSEKFIEPGKRVRVIGVSANTLKVRLLD